MQRFSLDHLTETQFEEFCYDLLAELGFTNMSWRKGTGLSSSPSDRGRDIECQLIREDVDGDTILETWFVECKHYKQGVPPDAIHGALSWATSERPDKLLIIASNFLSNPTKDYLTDYQRNNRPSFKIKCWERPCLEKLSLEKLDLLRKYEIFAHLSDTNAYAYTSFMTYFMDFEAALHTSLQIMGVAMPKQAFQSAMKMWRLFIYQVGEVSKHYVKDVEEVIVTRNKLVHGADLSLTPEEIMGLITPLRRAIRFVQTYCISSDILPELKEKYSQWLRPEIISVRIIQKTRTVFLEIATKTKHQGLADEAVTRTDLGFMSDGTDKDQFPSERTAQENAECFVNKLDPYSIMMCTDLFTEEGCKEVDRLFNSKTTMEN
jgi:hypothetical protein